MMRKFRRIFRSPTTATATTTKNEPIQPTSSSDSTSDNMLHNKQRSSSATNHLYTGTEKKPQFFNTYAFFSCI
jgi:hypothetical protein